jgi:membrane-associated protein
MELFDIPKLIESIGYVGIFAIVFAESGLFFGFFFPGDSMLLTAGLLASRGILNIFVLIVGIFIAAVLGDNVGYW